jgi:hypothetical protein
MTLLALATDALWRDGSKTISSAPAVDFSEPLESFSEFFVDLLLEALRAVTSRVIDTPFVHEVPPLTQPDLIPEFGSPTVTQQPRFEKK